jgi:hypothetical protein
MASAAFLPTRDVALFDDLGALARDACGALDNGDCPYRTLEWLRMTRDHVLGTTPLIAARARDGADVAWWVLTGAGEAYSSWYSLRVGPITSGRPRPDLLADAARALRSRLAKVSLAPMSESDAAIAGTAFRQGGWWTREREATANWVAHTQGLSFDDYWAARPSRLRNTVARKRRAAGLEIVIADRFDAGLWSEYEAVHAASWKGAEGSPAFLRAMAGCATGLRLGIARKDGRPVATQLWTIDGSTATIHKLAYEEAARALSPGAVLGHAMFEHVLTRDRPALIDYGTGDDAYKAEWMDERRSLRRMDAWNPLRLGGLARAARAYLRG